MINGECKKYGGLTPAPVILIAGSSSIWSWQQTQRPHGITIGLYVIGSMISRYVYSVADHVRSVVQRVGQALHICDEVRCFFADRMTE